MAERGTPLKSHRTYLITCSHGQPDCIIAGKKKTHPPGQTAVIPHASKARLDVFSTARSNLSHSA